MTCIWVWDQPEPLSPKLTDSVFTVWSMLDDCIVVTLDGRLGLTRSNEAQREAYQKCFLECYYCTTVLGELSDIPVKSAGPYIHVGQA